MKNQAKVHIPKGKVIKLPKSLKTVSAEQIVASLLYLHQSCSLIEFKPILKISLNLTYSSMLLEERGKGFQCLSDNNLNPTNIFSSLQYLMDEASRNDLEDIAEILQVTLRLCFLTYYYSVRGKYRSVNYPC